MAAWSSTRFWGAVSNEPRGAEILNHLDLHLSWYNTPIPMISRVALFVFLPLVSTFPLERSTNWACGQFETVSSDLYSLLSNLWGKSDAMSGSQCSRLVSVVGNNVTWSSSWSWTGGTKVKSFSNIQLNKGINRQLGAISSMHSEWRWSQANTGTVVSDVAYDLFTSYSPGGSSLNEVMVWLATFDAQPISYNYDYYGNAIPIATDLGIAGHTWNLYQGTNSYNEVYSFLPVEGHKTAFSGDIFGFFIHLIDTGNIASSEYLVTAQAGVEATSGTAFFETLDYSLKIT